MACDPESLSISSACFDCLDDQMMMAIQTYLLAVIAGGSTDPNVLQSEAKAFQGLSHKSNLEIQAYLLCQIAGI
jgi:hypothetical protein